MEDAGWSESCKKGGMLRPTQQKRVATASRRSHRSARPPRDSSSPDTIEKLTAELERYKRRLESSQCEFQRVAMTDPLTGCHNRRFFDQFLDREVQRHARYNIPLTLVFVDVDRFKSVNDDMGHAMGDRLVQHVVSLLQRHVRGSDYVFRWGGDEFVALMSCTERDAASKSAQLKAGFAVSVQGWALPPGLGLSVGCAELGHAAGNIEALLEEADARMYADKHRRQAPVGSHLMTETRPQAAATA